MEISHPERCSINLQEKRPEQLPIFRFCEIILVDRTPPYAHPTLFQLTQKSNSNLEDSFEFDCKDFSLLGEVFSVDNEKKIVMMVNGDQIGYKHLIVSSCSRSYFQFKHTCDEYEGGIHTLSNALRLQKCLHFSQTPKDEDNFANHHRAGKQVEEQTLANIQNYFPPIRLGGNYPAALTPKRYFLLQIDA